ncbi:sulfite oxidase [Denitromonas ohlonensis]|uniref:Sulfite oxidase n=2 Tax=Denitromonas TaxID=139331 RepID=A0A557S172_9RHOO|nr:sulfite oxidase [Denitromonas ohlonensis]TVO59918.1 sulfite oxidase [Denitromonas ohlonensis]TVO71173.1 sulfite oxidase [Denitromonas ohlonensis]
MTKKKQERGIHELYAQDPQQADWLLWGRKVDSTSRRGFLKKTGLLAMTAAVGAHIPFWEKMPGGLIPAALAASPEPFVIPGRDGLIVHNDRPINAETPAHLLDDKITPAHRMFVRNNGIPPVESSVDPATWTLEIAGESCVNPMTFTIAQLKERFEHHTYQLQIECGGNGRSEFNPPAKGNQWVVGAIACPTFTGVRLRDVLKACGIKDDAVYVGYYGADTHLSGDPDKVVISRGVPMEKALRDETLIAWAMNGEDIPALNGHPLRLVAGGWPGSTSGKWLKKIVIRNKEHDGPKMTGQSYRVPCTPVAPGAEVAAENMCVIGSMPVKSLITFPESGIVHPQNKPLSIRGHAWAGDLDVDEVLVSIDFGATWQKASLERPANPIAWQHWSADVTLPSIGYFEIWARAVDSTGRSQPMVMPGWNPRGYLNNACHRVAVKAV